MGIDMHGFTLAITCLILGGCVGFAIGVAYATWDKRRP